MRQSLADLADDLDEIEEAIEAAPPGSTPTNTVSAPTDVVEEIARWLEGKALEAESHTSYHLDLTFRALARDIRDERFRS